MKANKHLPGTLETVDRIDAQRTCNDLAEASAQLCSRHHIKGYVVSLCRGIHDSKGVVSDKWRPTHEHGVEECPEGKDVSARIC